MQISVLFRDSIVCLEGRASLDGRTSLEGKILLEDRTSLEDWVPGVQDFTGVCSELDIL